VNSKNQFNIKYIIYINLNLLLQLKGTETTQAQIIKGFGKKLERKIEERIERKADRQVDKVLDKADKKTDESINDAFSKSSTKAKDEKGANTQNTAQQIPAKPEHAMTIVAASCQDFSWCKKGAILAYETLEKKEKAAV